METEIFFGLLLRILPAVVVFGLAFLAMSDKKTRERWNNLLYQVGSIRPDQREDIQIGRSVKWPFFLVALCLLLWPIQFYRHATKTIDVTASDLHPATETKGDLTATNSGNSIASNGVSGNGVSDNAVSNAGANTHGDLRTPAPAAAQTPASSGDLVPAQR